MLAKWGDAFKRWARGKPMRRYHSLFSGNPVVTYTDYYEPPWIVTALQRLKTAAKHFGRKVIAHWTGIMATVAVVVGIIALFM